jgi:hypothetical protein
MMTDSSNFSGEQNRPVNFIIFQHNWLQNTFRTRRFYVRLRFSRNDSRDCVDCFYRAQSMNQNSERRTKRAALGVQIPSDKVKLRRWTKSKSFSEVDCSTFPCSGFVVLAACSFCCDTTSGKCFEKSCARVASPQPLYPPLRFEKFTAKAMRRGSETMSVCRTRQ